MEERPNVKIVQQIYALFQQKDLPSIFELFSDSIEMNQSTEVPWGGNYQGHDGARQFFAKLTATVTSKVVFERFIDADEKVVAIGRTQGTVNASGAVFDVPIAHIWTIENHKATGVQFCIDNPTMLASLRR